MAVPVTQTTTEADLEARQETSPSKAKRPPGPALAIVPAYNEQATIGRVVGDLKEKAPGFDVVVIDDGSTDRTAERAAGAGATVIKLPFNLGIGGAMQTGYRYALENGYELAAQVDGDGQHDVDELDQLVEVMREDPTVDSVAGSRFLEKSSYRVPLARRTGIRLFSFMVSTITRQKVTDPTSGFRLVNRRGIELFARDYPIDYPEVEAILMVHAHRLKMREVAVRMHDRTGGRSSITRYLSIYYMVKVSLALFVGLFRSRPVIEPGDPAPVEAEHNI
jgi:glycosyltransferase involved in cell wall biosynthesis